MPRPLLITAFQPFGGDGRNPSAEVLTAIVAESSIDGLVAEVLPVIYAVAGQRVAELIAEHRPAAWVGLGLHAGATAIRLERQAANCDDASLADNAGDIRRGISIDPAGPEYRPATLPWDAIAAAMAGPVEFSDSAGRFVCNHTFYRAAETAARASPGTRVGFVHLPWPSDWPARASDRRVVHDCRFADLVAGVRTCLEVLAGPTSGGLRTLAV